MNTRVQNNQTLATLLTSCPQPNHKETWDSKSGTSTQVAQQQKVSALREKIEQGRIENENWKIPNLAGYFLNNPMSAIK